MQSSGNKGRNRHLSAQSGRRFKCGRFRASPGTPRVTTEDFGSIGAVPLRALEESDFSLRAVLCEHSAFSADSAPIRPGEAWPSWGMTRHPESHHTKFQLNQCSLYQAMKETVFGRFGPNRAGWVCGHPGAYPGTHTATTKNLGSIGAVLCKQWKKHFLADSAHPAIPPFRAESAHRQKSA